MSFSPDRVWLPVAETGAVGAVRRAATAVAAQMNLSEARTADLAIVATEIASNLYKHAVDGMAYVQAVRRGGQGGVEVIGIDKGPGMADLARSREDGTSTAGTLGIGLGAIARQSTEFHAYSRPGSGTVVAATVWEGQAPPTEIPDMRARGLVRPMSGEDVTGDGFGVRARAGRLQLMLCDGLGHGPLAALAAQATEAAFRDAPDVGPKVLIELIHSSIRHTRGAVVTVVEVDPDAGTLRFAGLGNIGGAVVDGDQRRLLSAQPGIAGHQRPQVRELDLPYPAAAVIVMHTDGVTDRWSLADYPGVTSADPIVIAATILRDASIRRDDAAVLVAKASP